MKSRIFLTAMAGTILYLDAITVPRISDICQLLRSGDQYPKDSISKF